MESVLAISVNQMMMLTNVFLDVFGAKLADSIAK